VSDDLRTAVLTSLIQTHGAIRAVRVVRARHEDRLYLSRRCRVVSNGNGGLRLDDETEPDTRMPVPWACACLERDKLSRDEMRIPLGDVLPGPLTAVAAAVVLALVAVCGDKLVPSWQALGWDAAREHARAVQRRGRW